MIDEHLALVIGNRNYSSWSLRGWLAMKLSGLPFEEIFIPLNRPETAAALSEHSPSKLVPVLKISETIVWDSLAIIEALNDLAPDAEVWPREMKARAVARSISAEMHSGFYRLRRDMPMDIRADKSDEPKSEEALTDIKRIEQIWLDCRETYGADGPFLFGAWSAADIMYAPVVTRIRTYDVTLDPQAETYMDAVFGQTHMADWVLEARNEPYVIDT